MCHLARRYDYFQLPDISPAMLTHSVEVRVRASFSSEGYGTWAAVRPELLLLKARPLPAAAQLPGPQDFCPIAVDSALSCPDSV